MKLPINATEGHQGKSLEVDCDLETITLLDEQGQMVGSISWGSVVKLIKTAGDEEAFINSRDYPRASLAVKVRYMTKEGKKFESLTGGLGGGGLFIESSSPLPQGSELNIEFSLPDRPGETLVARARVAWTRTKAERYLLFPGMGVQFTEIEPDARQRLEELVKALNRSRRPG